MFWQTILMSIREIRRNLMRSILTILGIVIGVASVIIMVTLGLGATSKVGSEISSIGSNLIWMEPSYEAIQGGASTSKVNFVEADSEAIEREIDNIQAVAPCAQGWMPVINGNQNKMSEIDASTNAYLVAREWGVALGRSFTEAEIKAGKAVCILGSTVREELFGGENPVGSTIRLRNIALNVIGVLESKGSFAFGLGDMDNIVLVPLKMYQRRILGNKYVSYIIISTTNADAMVTVKEDVTKLMRERRRISVGEEDTFQFSDQQSVASTVNNVLLVLTGVLSAIAAVSLLVGGVGIMNIMLVSVTERTREIGIRLAIGALEKNVLIQFLVEAMVLTSFGGVIGIVLGLTATYFISKPLQLPFGISLPVIVVAFVFSAAVGVVFGFFPARKAARLDPIDALRHE